MNPTLEYTIDWLEKKEAFGKPALECTMSAGGVTTDKVTIYKYDKENKEFPGFDSIMPGAKIVGRIYTNPKGYKSFYASTPKPERGPNYGMKAAQERKAEQIETAQENKANHIKEAAAQRDAVNIVIAFYSKRLSEDPILGEPELDRAIKDKIEEWRKYFLNQSQEIPF